MATVGRAYPDTIDSIDRGLRSLALPNNNDLAQNLGQLFQINEQERGLRRYLLGHHLEATPTEFQELISELSTDPIRLAFGPEDIPSNTAGLELLEVDGEVMALSLQEIPVAKRNIQFYRILSLLKAAHF